MTNQFTQNFRVFQIDQLVLLVMLGFVYIYVLMLALKLVLLPLEGWMSPLVLTLKYLVGMHSCLCLYFTLYLVACGVGIIPGTVVRLM